MGQGTSSGLFFNHGNIGMEGLRQGQPWPQSDNERVPWSNQEEMVPRQQLEETNKQLALLQRELMAIKQAQQTQLVSSPADSENIQEEARDIPQAVKVSLPLDIVREVEADYAARCLVGLLFGPIPPVETLKRWINDTWTPLGVEVESVQVLPKGYYICL